MPQPHNLVYRQELRRLEQELRAALLALGLPARTVIQLMERRQQVTAVFARHAHEQLEAYTLNLRAIDQQLENQL